MWDGSGGLFTARSLHTAAAIHAIRQTIHAPIITASALVTPISLRPSGTERRAIQLGASQIDAGDPAHVPDVVERVRIEHQEISLLARLDRSDVVQTERLRRPRGPGEDRLRRGHAEADERFELEMLRV